MKKVFCYSGLIICIAGVIVAGYLYRSGPATTVVLVRHTEKAAIPPDDPPLSPEGVVRAKSLAHVLKDTGIDVIIATQFQRTAATVAPAAAQAGITPIIMPAMNIQAFVDSINSAYEGKEILIAGHSNTIPAIIEALGISTPPTITENDYDDLFVVQIRHHFFRPAKLTHLSYGNPSL
jgi:broad specificity phosphatase PhoE